MSQWREIQTLAKSRTDVALRLGQIYRNDRKYLLDIRQSCSEWMENIDWLSYDINAPETINVAQRHFKELLSNIDNAIKQPGIDIVKKINLGQSQSVLQETFQGNLLLFLDTIQQCLKEEKLLIQSCAVNDAEPRAQNTDDQAQDNLAIAESLRNLSIEIQIAERALLECQDFQNRFRIEYNSDNETIAQLVNKIKQHVPGTAKHNELTKEITHRQADVASKINTSFHKRIAVATTHKEIAEKTKKMAQEIWREIEKWKQECKLQITGLSKPKEGIIDVLERMCNHMNQIIIQLLAQLDKLHRLTEELQFAGHGQTDRSKQLCDSALLMIEQVLKVHLAKVFVVDRNPPRVLKVITGKSLGFAMSCRILGGHALGLQMNPPKVSVKLFKENDLDHALQSANFELKGMCTVINGQNKVMEFHRERKYWVAMFNSVQLQHVKQLEKNTERLVMENMNAMVFYTQISIRSKEYKLSTMSLPLVLISHVLQDCQAKAFLMWDAAFSDDDTRRKAFEHPEEVEWKRVAALLDALFKEHTGRGLKEEHLNYLGRIAFKERKQPDPVVLNVRKISKSQLIKDKLQKDFQFWKWFYANMNLIKERLKQEWQDNLIYGFIAKDEAYKKLSIHTPGTFMLRFSESDIENSNKADICGCLTMAVIEKDPEKMTPRVYHVKEHLTPKDIYERGLATTLEAFEVKDFESGQKRPLLTNLWPNREFHQTFNKYILQKRKEVNEENDGYKAGQLRIEIFLADDPTGRRRGGGLPSAHAQPMSPGNMSVFSDAMSPLPAYPMSPPATINGMDDSSQQPFSPQQMGTGSRPQPHPVENGKFRAIAMVAPTVPEKNVSMNGSYPVASPAMSTSSSSIGSPLPASAIPVNDMDRMRLSSVSSSVGSPQQSQGGPPSNMSAHNEVIYENAAETMLIGQHVVLGNQSVLRQTSAHHMALDSGTPMDSGPAVNSGSSGTSALLFMNDDMNEDVLDPTYFDNLNSGDIEIGSASQPNSGGLGVNQTPVTSSFLANSSAHQDLDVELSADLYAQGN